MSHEIDVGMTNALVGASVPEDAFLECCWDFILEPAELHGASEPYHFRKFDYSPSPGVYFLFQDDRIVYAGKATNLELRLKQHYRTKIFNRITYLTGIPEMFIEDVEAFYIHAATPDLNRQYPPKGRVCRAMLSMIQRASSQ